VAQGKKGNQIMAQGFSAETLGVLDGTVPPAKADGRVNGANLAVFQATFDLSLTTVKGASGDTNVCFRLPRGFKPMFLALNASATMGATATIAVGNSTTAGKYRAAAVFTAAALTWSMLSTASDDAPLTADEDVLITIAAAALPGAGILQVFMVGSRL
jgi:hypothetical protein